MPQNLDILDGNKKTEFQGLEKINPYIYHRWTHCTIISMFNTRRAKRFTIENHLGVHEITIDDYQQLYVTKPFFIKYFGVTR